MILVIMHMKVPSMKRKELSQTITSLLGPIRTETGCGRCDFFQGTGDDNILCLLEEWETRKDFEIHCKSDGFKVLRGAMSLLEEPGAIIFYEKSKTDSEGEINKDEFDRLKKDLKS
ncbi:MAG: hypothetical protein A2521_02265 [Deltaproteobacteria bacterium RIFOXYD12_FULL_57_12]|nr:MAG: hypothetical protein A2521_02265 [Deltaproteobacteria bacterium RIFOXYD12_FULL_57_12]